MLYNAKDLCIYFAKYSQTFRVHHKFMKMCLLYSCTPNLFFKALLLEILPLDRASGHF